MHGAGCHRVKRHCLIFGQVSHAPFRPDFLSANGIQAMVNGNAGHPVFQGHLALKLIQFLEHFHKDVLCQVFLGRSTRKISPYDSDHRRMQVFHQGAGGILVLLAHSRQAICDVQIQVFADYDTRSARAVSQKSCRLTVA